ncbi:MAG: hypothetical protein ACE5IL_16040 [Myxococcota bacterium]
MTPLDETRSGLRFGIYYSGGMDWLLNPERIDSPEKIYSTVLRDPEHVTYADAHWRELIDRYAPSVLWGDIMYPEGADVPALFADYYNRVGDGAINDRFATRWITIRGLGPLPQSRFRLLGHEGDLDWKPDAEGVRIRLPRDLLDHAAYALRLTPLPGRDDRA